MQAIKCVLDGGSAVGKTCLLIRYTSNSFPSEYIPSVFDNYSANVMVDGRAVNLGLWDYAAREDSDRLRPLSYPQTSVFLVCYAVNNVGSLKIAFEKWIPSIQHHCPNVPIVLCTTKIDLEQDASMAGHLVPHSEALEVQKQFGLATVVRCSALTGVGVKEVFDTCIRQALEPLPKASSGKRSHCHLL